MFFFFFAENTSDVQTSLQNIVQYFSDAAESFVKVQSSILVRVAAAHGGGGGGGRGQGTYLQHRENLEV